MREGTTFRHGIASGDPTTAAVVIWTRVTTDDESVPVQWKVAGDEGLTDIVCSGDAVADVERDHCVSIDVTGLVPGQIYFYGFEAEGEASPVGRTWTLRADAERLRFACCSCAKYNAGYFNAYARIAERDDLDFLLHLGDYIYEAGNIPAKGQTPGADIGRDFDPLEECRTLPDYRRRYAQYHRDPDVQALHLALPIIPMLDDHELADGAWAGGADAHDPDEHGTWSERRATAFRVRSEWLPVREPDRSDPERVFRRVGIGDLADLLLVDIRSRRDRPAPVAAHQDDPSRSMLGTEQREWLFGELERSSAAWRLLVTPSILVSTWVENPSEALKTALLKLKLMDEDAEGPDEDQWDGYPAERSALIERIERAGDTVVVSADIHVSMASDVTGSGGTVAAEFTAPSLTSQNLDEKLGVEPRSPEVLASEDAFLAAHPNVHWCEMSGHGYMVCEVTRDRVRAEWWHVEGVLERLPGEELIAAYEMAAGEISPRAILP